MRILFVIVTLTWLTIRANCFQCYQCSNTSPVSYAEANKNCNYQIPKECPPSDSGACMVEGFNNNGVYQVVKKCLYRCPVFINSTAEHIRCCITTGCNDFLHTGPGPAPTQAVTKDQDSQVDIKTTQSKEKNVNSPHTKPEDVKKHFRSPEPDTAVQNPQSPDADRSAKGSITEDKSTVELTRKDKAKGSQPTHNKRNRNGHSKERASAQGSSPTVALSVVSLVGCLLLSTL